LSRRDNTSQSDHLWVSFDTYHDRRTAYSFGVTASGVRMDWYHPQDNEYNLDPGFDPVWEAKAVVDSLGWTTEMRIPFSQLRFNDAPVQVWGFNADHWNPATSEEVFFDEKRPFFTEGAQLLRGNGPSYFYSRRIGGPPRGPVSGDFVDYPRNSTILGAAKVTGRLASGMSLGALAAVTARESARTYDTASAGYGRVPVAPAAGYGVARLQQEFGASRSVVGATFTAVHRDISATDPLAAWYNRGAFAGGADWVLRWDRGAYELRGWLGFSRISGDTAAINRVQQSAVHFFQRPDADYLIYDPKRTSLTGSVANLEFRKTSGSWLYDLDYGWESPAYDPNDAGRLGNADGRFGSVNLGYRQT